MEVGVKKKGKGRGTRRKKKGDEVVRMIRKGRKVRKGRKKRKRKRK